MLSDMFLVTLNTFFTEFNMLMFLAKYVAAR